MKIIVEMIFGSHLYGTNTPKSDQDFKVVYMPEKKDIYLQKVKTSYVKNTSEMHKKNTSEDVDCEYIPFMRFIELAMVGDTMALDMLHAPNDKILHKHVLWDKIVKIRNRFYTKNLKSFMGYAKNQADKYGIKGSRIHTAETVRNILLPYVRTPLKMSEVWNLLPENVNAKHIECSPNGIKQYCVCGKILQENQKVSYADEVLNGFLKKYGHRAYLARENKDIDWKAISHAMRAAIQVQHILKYGKIIYPLPEAEYLTKVKEGKIDYKTEIEPRLEQLMNDAGDALMNSDLPETVDVNYWEDFIVECIDIFYKEE